MQEQSLFFDRKLSVRFGLMKKTKRRFIVLLVNGFTANNNEGTFLRISNTFEVVFGIIFGLYPKHLGGFANHRIFIFESKEILNLDKMTTPAKKYAPLFDLKLDFFPCSDEREFRKLGPSFLL